MQVPTKFTSQSQCVLALQDLQKALQPRGHYGVRMTLKILTVKSKTQLTKELSGTEMKRTCALHRLSGYPETRGRGRKLENLKATTSAHWCSMQWPRPRGPVGVGRRLHQADPKGLESMLLSATKPGSVFPFFPGTQKSRNRKDREPSCQQKRNIHQQRNWKRPVQQLLNQICKDCRAHTLIEVQHAVKPVWDALPKDFSVTHQGVRARRVNMIHTAAITLSLLYIEAFEFKLKLVYAPVVVSHWLSGNVETCNCQDAKNTCTNDGVAEGRDQKS